MRTGNTSVHAVEEDLPDAGKERGSLRIDYLVEQATLRGIDGRGGNYRTSLARSAGDFERWAGRSSQAPGGRLPQVVGHEPGAKPAAQMRQGKTERYRRGGGCGAG